MAWINEAGGWGGWIIVALLPLSFWAFIVTVLVLVFRRSATVELPAPVEQMARDREASREPVAEPSGLGWGPPVPSHH